MKLIIYIWDMGLCFFYRASSVIFVGDGIWTSYIPELYSLIIFRVIFNGLRPGSAAPLHLRISARDERKHACTDPLADTKTDAET